MHSVLLILHGYIYRALYILQQAFFIYFTNCKMKFKRLQCLDYKPKLTYLCKCGPTQTHKIHDDPAAESFPGLKSGRDPLRDKTHAGFHLLGQRSLRARPHSLSAGRGAQSRFQEFQGRKDCGRVSECVCGGWGEEENCTG